VYVPFTTFFVFVLQQDQSFADSTLHLQPFTLKKIPNTTQHHVKLLQLYPTTAKCTIMPAKDNTALEDIAYSFQQLCRDIKSAMANGEAVP
jgi:hypothetical protein